MKDSEMVSYPSDPNFPKITPGPFVVSSSGWSPPMMNLVVGAVPSNGYIHTPIALENSVGAAMSFPTP
jgi:hypothetical protein